LLRARLLLSAYSLAVSCYKCMRLTTSTYDIMSSWPLHTHASGSFAVLLFEVLEQSSEFANIHVTWQCASPELAICTACVGERQVSPRALLHALNHNLCIVGKDTIGLF